MKAILLLSALFLSVQAHAAEVVSYMEVSFGCDHYKVVMDKYAINYRFQTGESRWEAVDSRIRFEGNLLELVGVGAERTVVIGTLESAPTCQQDDSDHVNGEPSWNAIRLSPAVRVVADESVVAGTCVASGAGYLGNNQYSISVESSWQPAPAVFTWTKPAYYQNLAQCQQ